MHIIIFLFYFLMIPMGWASDYHSPRTVALGGAGRAGPILNDAIYLNPSFGAYLPAYSMAFNYMWHDQQGIGKGRMYNASVQDGQSPLFQAGLGFTQTESTSMLHVGASGRVVQRVGFGLGGKVFIPSDGRSRVTDMVFSTTALPAEWLHAVLVVDNLLESAEGRARGLYREFVLGFKVNVQGICLLYFDPNVTPSLPSGDIFGHSSAAEFTLLRDLFLRVGFFRNTYVPFAQTRGQGLGWGVGWVAPKLSLDYGMSRMAAPVEGTAHTVGMTVYF